jgi:hypothetical protein
MKVIGPQPPQAPADPYQAFINAYHNRQSAGFELPLKNRSRMRTAKLARSLLSATNDRISELFDVKRANVLMEPVLAEEPAAEVRLGTFQVQGRKIMSWERVLPVCSSEDICWTGLQIQLDNKGSVIINRHVYTKPQPEEYPKGIVEARLPFHELGLLGHDARVEMVVLTNILDSDTFRLSQATSFK